MPTFANVQLQNLLDPGAPQKPLSNGDQDSDPVNGGPTPRHVHISPVLYVTPEQAPMPEYSSPDPVFSSPYVVNNKRRGGGNEPRRVGPGNVPDLPPENEGGGLGAEMMVGGNSVNENDDFDDDEGFLDTRSEAISVGSEVEANNDFSVGGKSESGDVVSTQGDFFDAIDDFSSDVSISSVHSSGSRIESELHTARLSVLEEVERRRVAEETLSLMRNQWERISSLMSEAGLTFPAPPDAAQLESSSIDQLSQEIVVARFVEEVVGRVQARSEAEEAAAAMIESKDQEISRLQDRLQYFETVNHEMSQRKLVEVARRQQEKKKRSRRRWIWSVAGVSIAVGVALFAGSSYFPEATKYVSWLKSGDFSDSSFVSPSSSESDAS